MTRALAGARERAKADRRQRIFDAVLAILCEEGLPALSTARIGARAGLSVATLYNLIGGVDQIVDRLLEQLFEGLEQALLEPVAIASPVPEFEGYVEATWRYLAAREEPLRAAQRAVFQRALTVGASSPVLDVAARSGPASRTPCARCSARGGSPRTPMRACSPSRWWLSSRCSCRTGPWD